MSGEAEIAVLRDALLAGGVALVPTDTVYGLAAALDSDAGVAALYALKGRLRSQPCQVILYARPLLEEALLPLDDLTRAAAEALVPGPTTCLVPDPAGRYSAAAGESPGSVGLRAPLVDVDLAVIDFPLVGTSANDPGGPDPARVADVPARIRAGTAAILDRGSLPGTASTVVDLRPVAGGRPVLLVRIGTGSPDVVRRLAALGIAAER